MSLAPDYLPRLEKAMSLCQTKAQFHSVWHRADISNVIDDPQTSTEDCLKITAIVRRERDRIERAQAR